MLQTAWYIENKWGSRRTKEIWAGLYSLTKTYIFCMIYIYILLTWVKFYKSQNKVKMKGGALKSVWEPTKMGKENCIVRAFLHLKVLLL